MSAVANRNFDAVRVLLDYKADINLVCGSGVSALSAAIKRNEVETVKFLIETGADVKNEPVRKALQYINVNGQNDYESGKTDEIIKLVETARVK